MVGKALRGKARLGRHTRNLSQHFNGNAKVVGRHYSQQLGNNLLEMEIHGVKSSSDLVDSPRDFVLILTRCLHQETGESNHVLNPAILVLDVCLVSQNGQADNVGATRIALNKVGLDLKQLGE